MFTKKSTKMWLGVAVLVVVIIKLIEAQNKNDPEGSGFLVILLWLMAGPIFLLLLLLAKNLDKSDVTVRPTANKKITTTTPSRFVAIIIGTVTMFFTLAILYLLFGRQ